MVIIIIFIIGTIFNIYFSTLLDEILSKGERIWTDGEASTIASAIMAVVFDNKGGYNKQYQNMTNVYYFILDEFGNFSKIPDFANKLTVGGGRGNIKETRKLCCINILTLSISKLQ